MSFLIDILAIIFGYLIGSISPAYFFGRILKGIDLREYGDKNLGASNVKNVLGWVPGIVTTIFDLGKGLLAFWLARMFGVDAWLTYTAGFMAVIGHVFPFYLKFKGGQGQASAIGQVLFFLTVILVRQWFPYDLLLPFSLLALVLFYISRSGTVVGLFTMPTAILYLLVYSYHYPEVIYLVVLIAFVWIINIRNTIRGHLLKPKTDTFVKVKAWRIYARPLAVLFPIFLLNFGRGTVLWIAGIVCGLSIIFEIVRLINKRFNARLKAAVIRQREHQRFSTISMFLVGTFLTLLLFEKEIAVAALVFVVFGDIFAKFFGLQYGQRRLFASSPKTLEGTGAHFVFCLTAGYLINHFIGIPLYIVVPGALFASLVEVIPWNLNDNLSVPLISAAVMTLLSYI